MEVFERVAATVGGERLAVRLNAPSAARSDLTLLYLHGFGSRQEGEKASRCRAGAVAEGWSFCSFDFRGHGASEGSLRDLTLSRNLEDVAAVRAWLGRRGHCRLALVGSSMGGVTALWHAALEPAGVVAAVLISPAVGMAGAMARWAGPERLARWRRDGELRFESELVAADLDWGLMRDLERYEIADLAARHRAPTLVFQGELDESVDWREVAEFAALVPRGTVDLRLFPRGDHRLLEHLPEIWEQSRRFLKRQLDRGGGGAERG